MKGSFLFFILLSLLWHGAQILLISASSLPEPSPIDNHTNAIHISFAKTPAESPALEPNEIPVSNTVTSPPSFSVPTRLPTSPSLRQDYSIANKESPLQPFFSRNTKKTIPSTVLSATNSTGSVIPNFISGQLKKRSLVYQPPLPPYPVWAARAGLEPKALIALNVDTNGVVIQCNLLRGTGDLDTDLTILTFTKQMRFTPAPENTEGRVEWEFILE